LGKFKTVGGGVDYTQIILTQKGNALEATFTLILYVVLCFAYIETIHSWVTDPVVYIESTDTDRTGLVITRRVFAIGYTRWTASVVG
jgi:hypothetical protein